MKTALYIYLFLAAFLMSGIAAQAQKPWSYSGNFNCGMNIIYVFGKGQKFPGLRLYAGFSAMAKHKDHILLNYGPSLSVYTKTLGANINPLFNNLEVDLINSVSFGGWWGKTLTYDKYYRTMGNGCYYNVVSNQQGSALLTSNFILNTSGHNQVNGALSVTQGNVTIMYYNDGAPPISILPISDNFDRYWTGGIGLFIHDKRGYNTVELTFDQFTGYQPLLYEVSTMLGIDVPNYNLDTVGKSNQVPKPFNTSAYNLKVCPTQGFGIDVGAMGGLMSKNGTYFGLQEIIHTLGRFALHPNTDHTRYYFGGTYNNTNHVSFR